ncbi:MAG: glycoside hydrolase domain-containing protein [Mangrovibacterium sp.]
MNDKVMERKKNIIRKFIFLSVLLAVLLPAKAEENGLLLRTDALGSIWWTGSTCKVMRDAPVPAKKGKVVLRAARNETEGFQLVLSPHKNVEDLTVSISDFGQKGGSLIPAGNVVIRKVEYVHVTKPSGRLHQAGWYPDPLPLPGQSFRAGAGVNTPLWLNVKVPKDASPGVYLARISLRSASWEASIPVELKVWDFSLPDVPLMRSGLGLSSGMIRQYHNLKNEEELKQVLDLYYQSFRDYRISPQQFFDRYPIRTTVKGAWWNGGTFDPDTVFSGKYSYQITDNRVDGNVSGTHAGFIKIDPGKPYWLKWRAKTLNEDQQYVVTVKSYTADQQPVPWHLQGMYFYGSTQWRKDSLFLDPVNPLTVVEDMILARPIPENAAFIKIQLFPLMPDQSGRETGTAWFDDVQFLDGQTGENLLPHGNFEQDIRDLEVVPDFSEFDRAARKYLDEYGFTGFRVKIPELRPGPFIGRKTGWFSGFVNGTDEYRKLISQYLGQFQDHLEANGWLGKEYLYWIDEPKHGDYAFVREGMKTIREAAPKLTRFITENNPGPEIMDVTDVGCPVLAKFDPAKSREWIAKGRQMWSYLMTWPKAPHLNLFIDSDAINMRMWLWMSYRYGLTGILVWNSNVWNAEGCSPPGVLQNIWEDPMTYMDGHNTPIGAAAEYGNGDGMFFYPPNRDPNNDKTPYLTGPVPSLRLEILREGLDDYDYMVMLEKCIQNALPGQQGLVRKAKQLLNFGPEVFVNEQQYTKDPEVLMSYRRQMGDLLEQFHSK